MNIFLICFLKPSVPLNINVSQKKIRQTFGKISRNSIGVNIMPHFKNLKHHNIICLSIVKRNFLSITMEINSSLHNNSMVSLSGGDSSESSNIAVGPVVIPQLIK